MAGRTSQLRTEPQPLCWQASVLRLRETCSERKRETIVYGCVEVAQLNFYISDGEEGKRKIIVAIRPLSPTSATPAGTIEDLRASVEGLRLSPSNMVGSMITSISVVFTVASRVNDDIYFCCIHCSL